MPAANQHNLHKVSDDRVLSCLCARQALQGREAERARDRRNLKYSQPRRN